MYPSIHFLQELCINILFSILFNTLYVHILCYWLMQEGEIKSRVCCDRRQNLQHSLQSISYDIISQPLDPYFCMTNMPSSSIPSQIHPFPPLRLNHLQVGHLFVCSYWGIRRGGKNHGKITLLADALPFAIYIWRQSSATESSVEYETVLLRSPSPPRHDSYNSSVLDLSRIPRRSLLKRRGRPTVP